MLLEKLATGLRIPDSVIDNRNISQIHLSVFFMELQNICSLMLSDIRDGVKDIAVFLLRGSYAFAALACGIFFRGNLNRRKLFIIGVENPALWGF